MEEHTLVFLSAESSSVKYTLFYFLIFSFRNTRFLELFNNVGGVNYFGIQFCKILVDLFDQLVGIVNFLVQFGNIVNN